MRVSVRGRLWGGYLVGTAVMIAIYATASEPTTLAALWDAVAWSAVAATVAGIAIHRPAEPGPWWLTVGGLAATAAGAAVAPTTSDLAPDSVRVIVGGSLNLVSNLMVGSAVLWFVHLRTQGRDREGLTDGLIVTVALATVLWSVVIDPTALGAEASWTARAIYVVAPLLPAGITAICIRLVYTAGRQLVAARLLGGAWILAFLGSVGWVLLLQADAYVPGGWPDLVWAAALGCAGASALHPSMAEMSRPVQGAHRAEPAARLTVLGMALLATPLALLPVAASEGVNAVAPVAGAGLIALLVLGRLARLVQDRERDRRELETRAARQEVVATLGRDALGERTLADLYADAAMLVHGVLDDVEVTVRQSETDAALDVTRNGGDLSDDEGTFLATVAAVLAGGTARRRAEDDLRQRALYDGLTGLPNRALVLERLTQAVRQRDRAPVGVLFLDLDRFKSINDAHGHAGGDEVLTVLAARLAAVVRAGDTVGRLAGDEFVVVAPRCDEAGLEDLTERMLATVGDPVDIGDVPVSVTVSIGGVLATTEDRDPREVLRRADAAMYEAKAVDGGGSVETREPSLADRRSG